MGHGLFGGLKNIEVIISKWIVMWKLYSSIIYPAKNYLVQLFFKEILHYLKCHPFFNRLDVIINCISIYAKSFKNLSIQKINSTFIILYSFEQLSTYMSRTIIFINTRLFHFSTPFWLLEVSLVMGCNISSNPMSKFILSSHSAPKTILLLHILIFNL